MTERIKRQKSLVCKQNHEFKVNTSGKLLIADYSKIHEEYMRKWCESVLKDRIQEEKDAIKKLERLKMLINIEKEHLCREKETIEKFFEALFRLKPIITVCINDKLVENKQHYNLLCALQKEVDAVEKCHKTFLEIFASIDNFSVILTQHLSNIETHLKKKSEALIVDENQLSVAKNETSFKVDPLDISKNSTDVTVWLNCVTALKPPIDRALKDSARHRYDFHSKAFGDLDELCRRINETNTLFRWFIYYLKGMETCLKFNHMDIDAAMKRLSTDVETIKRRSLETRDATKWVETVLENRKRRGTADENVEDEPQRVLREDWHVLKGNSVDLEMAKDNLERTLNRREKSLYAVTVRTDETRNAIEVNEKILQQRRKLYRDLAEVF